MFLQRFTIFPDHMIKTQIQLIVGQHLLSVLCCFTSRILISILGKLTFNNLNAKSDMEYFPLLKSLKPSLRLCIVQLAFFQYLNY